MPKNQISEVKCLLKGQFSSKNMIKKRCWYQYQHLRHLSL